MTIKELKSLILVGVETEVNIFSESDDNFWKNYQNTVDFELDETIDDLEVSKERFRSVTIFDARMTIYAE